MKRGVIVKDVYSHLLIASLFKFVTKCYKVMIVCKEVL